MTVLASWLNRELLHHDHGFSRNPLTCRLQPCLLSSIHPLLQASYSGKQQLLQLVCFVCHAFLPNALPVVLYVFLLVILHVAWPFMPATLFSRCLCLLHVSAGQVVGRDTVTGLIVMIPLLELFTTIKYNSNHCKNRSQKGKHSQRCHSCWLAVNE